MQALLHELRRIADALEAISKQRPVRTCRICGVAGCEGHPVLPMTQGPDPRQEIIPSARHMGSPGDLGMPAISDSGQEQWSIGRAHQEIASAARRAAWQQRYAYPGDATR